MFNILLRTSCRPNYFNRCLQSICEQHYCNYRLIISMDDPQTEAYVIRHLHSLVALSKNKPVLIRVKKTPRNQQRTAPWNLYLNEMLAEVTAGWVVILDDDDRFASPGALERIAEKITGPDQLLIWQMQWPNGRKIPGQEYFNRPPQRKHIGMPCFAFHSKYKHHVRFDGMRAGDYRAISKLYRIIPHKTWIPNVLIQTGNTGLVGARKDLENEKTGHRDPLHHGAQ